jgi:hypothetical protein
VPVLTAICDETALTAANFFAGLADAGTITVWSEETGGRLLALAVGFAALAGSYLWRMSARETVDNTRDNAIAPRDKTGHFAGPFLRPAFLAAFLALAALLLALPLAFRPGTIGV